MGGVIMVKMAQIQQLLLLEFRQLLRVVAVVEEVIQLLMGRMEVVEEEVRERIITLLVAPVVLELQQIII